VTRGDEAGWWASSQKVRAALRAYPHAQVQAFLEQLEARGHLAAGDVPSAIALARDAVARFDAIPDPVNAPRARGVLAIALAALGELDEAWLYAEQAYQGKVGPPIRTLVMAQRGQVAALRGDRETAGQLLAEARALALRSGLGQRSSEIGLELEKLARLL
jgi:tetratricopeptide (TPR) repeat protein